MQKNWARRENRFKLAEDMPFPHSVSPRTSETVARTAVLVRTSPSLCWSSQRPQCPSLSCTSLMAEVGWIEGQYPGMQFLPRTCFRQLASGTWIPGYPHQRRPQTYQGQSTATDKRVQSMRSILSGESSTGKAASFCKFGWLFKYLLQGQRQWE